VAEKVDNLKQSFVAEDMFKQLSLREKKEQFSQLPSGRSP
jgi:hypothetical protein